MNENIGPKPEEALKGIRDSLTDEQKGKAKACRSMDELASLAGKEGMELPDELLDAAAGGIQAGPFDVRRRGEFKQEIEPTIEDGAPKSVRDTYL